MKKFFLLNLFLFILSSCSLESVETRISTAFVIAKNSGLKPFSISTKMYNIAGFHKITVPSKEITIYIEGDGLAWIDRYTVSNNPTPRNALALKLSLLDGSSNVIYLARPCQYVDLKFEKNCSSETWTKKQYSQSVILAYNEALNEINKVFKARGFHLVGFSGGAAIATLVTSQRSDVLSLRTIAGNLDHEALTNFHKATKLYESLNPIKIAHTISHIPQRHYSGIEDKVVPTWIAKSFVAATGNFNCADQEVIANVGHISSWQTIWKKKSKYIPKC